MQRGRATTGCSCMACTERVPAMPSRVNRRATLFWLGVSPILAAGCYTYAPLHTPEPLPETRVALVLSDQGRVGAGPNIGSRVARVEGALVGSTEREYTLRVA